MAPAVQDPDATKGASGRRRRVAAPGKLPGPMRRPFLFTYFNELPAVFGPAPWKIWLRTRSEPFRPSAG